MTRRPKDDQQPTTDALPSRGVEPEPALGAPTAEPTCMHCGEGYRRTDFEEAWERYLGEAPGFSDFEASHRPKVDETGTSRDFSSVPETSWDGSKDAELLNNEGLCDAGTNKNPGNGRAHESDQEITPSPPPSWILDEDRTCVQCRGPVDGKENLVAFGNGPSAWLHRECEKFYLQARCLYCGNPADAHRGAVTRDESGFLLHDGCRRDLQQTTAPWGGH